MGLFVNTYVSAYVFPWNCVSFWEWQENNFMFEVFLLIYSPKLQDAVALFDFNKLSEMRIHILSFLFSIFIFIGARKKFQCEIFYTPFV